jgi:predicted RecA/RadA family phage recombinase
MKNFLQPGDVITLTAPETLTSGRGVLVGQLFGIATAAAASGVAVEVATTGVFSHAKTGTQAWVQGQKVYWDNTAKVFTSVATGNTFVGHAVEAVAGGAGDVIGKVRLTGTPSTATF